MADESTTEKQPRFRSPPYPAVPLAKAIERVGTFYAKALHHSVPVSVAASAWEYAGKSSGLFATIAALKQFGLMSDEGSGDKRRFKLTDAGIRLARDQEPNSEKRRAAIRAAAMAPKIHSELWEKYGAAGASGAMDVAVKMYLTLDRADDGAAPYSDEAALDLINEYRATMTFAGLLESSSVSSEMVGPGGSGNPKDVESEISIGDLIQAEVGGVLAFPKPKRVRAIQEGWVFVEDYEAGVRMEDVELVEKSKGADASDIKAPRLPLPKKEEMQMPMEPGTRVLRFALTEGDVVVSFPENLSADSVDDLDGFWQVFLKRARREAGGGQKH